MADYSRPDIQSIQETALQTARSGRNMFITGSAGTGKSSLERILTKDAQSRGLNVTLAAPTGIAAEAIGGCTIHRLLGLSGALMEISDSGKPSLVRGSTKNLRGTDLLIIDEISMVSLPLFDILALTLDAADKEGHPVQLIVSGDFYQLPPVISPVEKASLSSIYPDTGRTYAFESDHWEKFNFHTVLLEQNFRQADPGFSTLLARLRTGDRSALPAFLALTSRRPLRNALWICGRKADAAARNNTGLEELGGIPSVYHAVTQGTPPEDSLPAPLSLTVRPHMPVMMTVNDPRGRFCNGSRGYVVSSGADCIYVSLDGCQGRLRISRHTWKLQDAGRNELTFSQFPIIPAFALTVHRTQGLTLEAANIIPYCWEPGQLYVMLSRVPDPHQIYIHGRIPESALVASPKVKAFYGGLIQSSLSVEGLLEAARSAEFEMLPTGLYRRGLRFGVFTFTFSLHGQQMSRSFIALRDRAGRWLGITDFHRYVRPARRIRPVSSDNGDRLYFITSFLNYLFVDAGCIDSLEEITIEMVRTFLAAYAVGAYGGRRRTSQTVNECTGIVIQFLLALLEDSSLSLVYTREDLFRRQYYFSRRGTLEARQSLAFTVQYDPGEHLLLRDMPSKVVQIFLSHIYVFHPDILLATSLQLFAGLRPSEPLAIHEGCLTVREVDGKVLSVSIDLTKEWCLRDDGVRTGRIKKHRTASVYPAFLQAFSDCYRRYREACAAHTGGQDPSPLCLDSAGRAMTYQTYYRRFKKAVSEIIPRLSSDNDPEVREYAMILADEGAAPHIWRHVFTQLLVLSGLTEAQIMNARGDSSPVSALAYLSRKSELMKLYSETAGRIASQLMEAARSYMGGAR